MLRGASHAIAVAIAGAAGGLVDKVSKVAEIVWRCFTVAGLSLNWGAAKTAALFRWHGSGATEAKRYLGLRRGTSMHSLVMSRHLLQRGAWPLLHRTEYNRFAATAIRLYRKI